MAFFYNLFLRVYFIAIKIAAIKNPKAKKWLSGRKNLYKKLRRSISDKDKKIWFHCASLGEFEQGRPIIESFKKIHPDFKIILSFFSPSGFEIRKNYEGADYICYFPLDLHSNSEKFINIINPELAVFIKYEFWFNTISILNKKKIPLIVVSAHFRKNQHFFRWYGKWFRKQLKRINHIFVQNNESAELLKSVGIRQVSISGDTRFDRVKNISGEAARFPLIEKFIGKKKVFLAGSSWPPEEEIVKQLVDKKPENTCFIIAPHDIAETHIEKIIKLFNSDAIRYSELKNNTYFKSNVLIIDSIGILNQLYQYARYAFIGGGFGPGIHNILEASCFGVPVFFGPNYLRFREAVELVELGGAFPLNNFNDLFAVFNKLETNVDLYNIASFQSQNYVNINTGATHLIINHINTIIKH